MGGGGGDLFAAHAWPHLFHEKGVQDFGVTTIFGRPRDLNRRKPKTQTACSFGNWEQWQYLTIIKMQNVTIDFMKFALL